MSAAESKENHLQWTSLTSSKVKEILPLFESWLAKARFEIADLKKSENLKICVDSNLDEASQPILIELNIYNKMISTDRFVS